MKGRNKIFFILLLGFFKSFTVCPQQIADLPFTQYYSSLEYEGGIQNWGITQNKEGLIYVANNFGLLEYDGSTWKRYILPNETKVRSVYIGRNGKIYVASQGDFGYFAPSGNGSLSFVSLADSLPDKYRNFDETWKIFQNEESLFFCTFEGIFVFDQQNNITFIEPGPGPENFHFVNNKLFTSQVDIGLTYMEEDSLILFDKGDFFKGEVVSAIIPLTNNHLLITTVENGVYTYDGNNYQPWNKKNQDQFKVANINNALRLKNGNIAIGTQNLGVFITDINGNIIQHLNKGMGLNNRTILSMYEDVIGNLWLGHNNGLTNVELNLPFSIINEQLGLPGTGYDGKLANGNMYVGTNNGLYYNDFKNPSGTYKPVKNTEGQVYNIQNVENNLLLAHHRGSFLVNNDESNQISDVSGAWTFLELKNYPDKILGGTYNGLILFEKEGGNIQYKNRIGGFKESSRVMEQDDKGNIWMTHGYKGVFKLKLNDDLDSVKVKFYGKESGLPSNILINVWPVNNRLIFSTEAGLYKYNADEDKFVQDPFFAEYFDKDCRLSYVEEDAIGNVYYIGASEMGVLEKLPNGTYKKRTKIFNRLRGILNDDLQNFSVLNTNYVLYGAKEGFILYKNIIDDITDIPYKTLIRKVSITVPSDSVISSGYYSQGGRIFSQQPEEQIPALSYRQNSISIEYSAPFYHGSGSTKYQYKLANLDDEWSEWTAKTDKEYTNLHEGTYTFLVRAKNIYGQTGKEAAFTFKVNAPWYRSTLAYALYLVVFIGILFLVYKYVEARHTREKELMTIKQKKEISRIDNELKQSVEYVERLKSEKLKAEVESKNKQLATSTMHLLNKNSFINSMKHNLNTIIKRSKNQEVKKELGKIMHNIEKNISEDNDWDDFAIYFDQVHGDFTKRIREDFPKLTPQEMKLSAYLRMNLSTKEIAHLLNISVRGVEIARYRLRKKLKMERSANLQEFILKY